MKLVIGIIVALIIIGGVAWFISSSNTSNQPTSSGNQPQSTDQLSENGRQLSTDSNVFEEIDDAVGALG